MPAKRVRNGAERPPAPSLMPREGRFRPRPECVAKADRRVERQGQYAAKRPPQVPCLRYRNSESLHAYKWFCYPQTLYLRGLDYQPRRQSVTFQRQRIMLSSAAAVPTQVCRRWQRARRERAALPQRRANASSARLPGSGRAQQGQARTPSGAAARMVETQPPYGGAKWHGSPAGTSGSLWYLSAMFAAYHAARKAPIEPLMCILPTPQHAQPAVIPGTINDSSLYKAGRWPGICERRAATRLSPPVRPGATRAQAANAA